MTRKAICGPGAWSAAGGRPRVLVEGPDAWAFAGAVEAAGYDVAICRGPGPDERCPLLVHGECAGAAGADAIVSALPTGDGVAIVRALRDTYPDTPVVVEAPRRKEADYPGASRFVIAPLSVAEVLASLADVLRD